MSSGTWLGPMLSGVSVPMRSVSKLPNLAHYDRVTLLEIVSRQLAVARTSFLQAPFEVLAILSSPLRFAQVGGLGNASNPGKSRPDSVAWHRRKGLS